ncbi:DUF4232 domain-containing protein [Streptomyces sp. NPDC002817]|uniref:DUF4232 domain-containing protein n=1 Tax=Streptomyces sp. NPDC088357 TaxID=3154655 RepID=UPI00341A123C
MKSVAVASTVADLLLAAPPSRATVSSPVCPERALVLRASSTGPDVVRVSVTRHGGRTCTVDRAPLVTFENLDGSALPVPRGTTGRYRLDPGDTPTRLSAPSPTPPIPRPAVWTH